MGDGTESRSLQKLAEEQEMLGTADRPGGVHGRQHDLHHRA